MILFIAIGVGVYLALVGLFLIGLCRSAKVADDAWDRAYSQRNGHDRDEDLHAIE